VNKLNNFNVDYMKIPKTHRRLHVWDPWRNQSLKPICIDLSLYLQSLQAIAREEESYANQHRNVMHIMGRQIFILTPSPLRKRFFLLKLF